MPNDDILSPPAAMTSLLRSQRDRAEDNGSRVTRLAVLSRADQALNRIEQLTIALEKAADEMEKQLATVRGRL